MHKAFAQLLPITFVGTSALTEDPSQVSSLAKLMDEYGTEIVIIAVFLLVFGGFCVAFIKILSKLINTISAQNDRIINALLSKDDPGEEKKESVKTINKNKLKSNKKDEEESTFSDKEEKSEEKIFNPNMFSKNMYSEKIFKEVSRSVISELRCDRVAIYVFHNGNKSPYGYSFVKMSCVHDQTLRGTTTNRTLIHQGVPLHVFSNIIDCLIRNDEYIVGNIYSHGIISADEQVRSFIDGSHTKALFALAIKDTTNEIAGFIVAEFNDEQDFSNTNNYNKVLTALKHMRTSIVPIIVDENFRSRYEGSH